VGVEMEREKEGLRGIEGVGGRRERE